MAKKLELEIRRFGRSQSAVDRAVREALQARTVTKRLKGSRYRVLAVEYEAPSHATREPTPPKGFQITLYNYSLRRSFLVTATFSTPAAATISERRGEPLPSLDEFYEAVDVVRRDRELGALLDYGFFSAYRPMPPIGDRETLGHDERTVNVGLMPPRRGDTGHEIVGVNLVRHTVHRYGSSAPSHSHASTSTCGEPESAGQPTSRRGRVGQTWVIAKIGKTELWRMLVTRPASSSGTRGSGVELQAVDYAGTRLLDHAHVPALNVQYEHNVCGPFLDWQYQEGMLDAKGRNIGRGFLLCRTKPRTILETGSDRGTHMGVAVFPERDQFTLVSEMQAGWYRYVSKWTFTSEGVIRPRFGFAATQNSCVCFAHHHHAYWRFLFNIENSRQLVREGNGDRQPRWTKVNEETHRFRNPDGRRIWKVEAESGKAYRIEPGPADGTARGDDYARGDTWFVTGRNGQPPAKPGRDTRFHLDSRLHGEKLNGRRLVVWYGAHFSHDQRHDHGHASRAHRRDHEDHYVGPDLVPEGWNEV